MMNGDKQLDNLINLIYETVLEPLLWKDVLLLCSRQIGGVAAHIMTIEKAKNKPVFLLAAGDGDLPAEENQLNYAKYYSKIDPRMEVMAKTKFDEWRYCYTSMDQHFVDKNEFYQDFLIPSGGRFAMGKWIDDNNEHKTVLGLHRSIQQTAFGDAERIAADRFTGHLQRALRLQKHTQHLQSKAELGSRVIDSFALTMLIVDQKACIKHLNSEAESLLSNGLNGLSCKNNCLFATSQSDNIKLIKLINQATGFPAVGGAMFLNRQGIPQARQIFVTPLPAASPLVKDWQIPLALILVIEDNQSLSSIQLLCKLYHFSPAETKVAIALFQGKSPEEYARLSGVSLNTVRTQIKSLYCKTGTSRQPELVSLLCRIPPVGIE